MRLETGGSHPLASAKPSLRQREGFFAPVWNHLGMSRPDPGLALPVGKDGARLGVSRAPLVGCVLAALPGVGLAAASFSAFNRTYGFVPVTDVALVVGFGAMISAALAYATRTKTPEEDSMVLVAVVATGFLLGFYAMGGWELGSGAILIPAACLMAYLGVKRTATAQGRKKTGWGLASALVAAGLGLAPSVLIVLRLWTANVYLPDLIREVGLASVLGLVASATFVGLAAGRLPRASARLSAGAA